jgi:hypothetical protein
MHDPVVSTTAVNSSIGSHTHCLPPPPPSFAHPVSGLFDAREHSSAANARHPRDTLSCIVFTCSSIAAPEGPGLLLLVLPHADDAARHASTRMPRGPGVGVPAAAEVILISVAGKRSGVTHGGWGLHTEGGGYTRRVGVTHGGWGLHTEKEG